MKLSERQEHIIQAVVEEYIGTGRPAGSATVLQRSGLNLSSATVRNEIAALEDQGLLLQLHTSGGRVPTTLGYRYYIEHLLPASQLPNEDQVTIRHQFYQAHTELDEWMKLAAAVIAHRAHNVALITRPRPEEVRLKHVELIESQPHTVLAIVVLADGTVLQEMLSTDETVSQDQLRAYADALNASLAGSRSVTDVEQRIWALPEGMRLFSDTIVRLMYRAGEKRMQVYHEGLGEMLSRPDFSGSGYPNLSSGERLRRVVDFLQQGIAMEDLLSMMALEDGVQVVIGGEAPLSELEDYSIVVGRYGGVSEGSGVLGVLGPTRMEYGRAISLVRYMTELMTDLVFGR
jgi:heat-inducible transcriptional repressor